MCKQLLTHEASKHFFHTKEEPGIQKDIAGFMVFEEFHEMLEQSTSTISCFWTELKRGEVNVFNLHKVGIKVAGSLKDTRRTMKEALQHNSARG